MTDKTMTTFDAAMIADGAFELTGYEATEENYLEAMQLLVTSGLAWQLQGRVGRACADLISQGMIEG